MARRDDWEYCEHCGGRHQPFGPTKVTVTGELVVTPKTTAKKKPTKKR